MSDFEIVTIDPSEVLDRTLTTMEEYVGEALYPGDERRIFAEAMVAVHAQLANIMNDASKQTMLKYARGKVLDALGERLGVTRLPGASAHCTIRFSVQTPLEQDVEIPKFTKVTSDSTHYFAIPERVHELTLPDGVTPYDASLPETWIFENRQLAAVQLLRPDKSPWVTLRCEAFPILAVWANAAGPFVCLEPWRGRTDDEGFAGELAGKVCEQRLAPGETEQISYSIEFHR